MLARNWSSGYYIVVTEKLFWDSFICTNFNPNLEIMIHVNWTFSLQLGAGIQEHPEGDTNMNMHGCYLPVSPLHTGLKCIYANINKSILYLMICVSRPK